MNDLTAHPGAKQPAQLAPLDTVAPALRSHGVRIELASHYSQLLDTKILSKAPEECDGKAQLQFSKILSEPDAYTVLVIIWQASPYVTDLHISNAGLKKKQFNSLNSYSLAVRLAQRPSEVAKLNTRIRGVALAAAAYGLVERIEVHRTLVELRATPLLHEFMIELSELDLRVIINFYRTLDVIPALGVVPSTVRIETDD